ncbi:HMA2 domain-containing protein [Pradoshia sp.]
MSYTIKILHSIPGRIRLSIPALSRISQPSAIKGVLLSISGIKEVRVEPLIKTILIYYDTTKRHVTDILNYLTMFFPPTNAESSMQLFSTEEGIKKDIWRSILSGSLLLIAFLRKNIKTHPDMFDYLAVFSTSYTVLSHGENRLRHPDVLTGLISIVSLGSHNILQLALATWIVNLVEVFNDIRRSSQINPTTV